jgi:hypothetical protein
MWESMRFLSLVSAKRHRQASPAVAAPANMGGPIWFILGELRPCPCGANLFAKAAPATLRWVRDVSWPSPRSGRKIASPLLQDGSRPLHKKFWLDHWGARSARLGRIFNYLSARAKLTTAV